MDDQICYKKLPFLVLFWTVREKCFLVFPDQLTRNYVGLYVSGFNLRLELGEILF